jgi:hypothetical protein
MGKERPVRDQQEETGSSKQKDQRKRRRKKKRENESRSPHSPFLSNQRSQPSPHRSSPPTPAAVLSNVHSDNSVFGVRRGAGAMQFLTMREYWGGKKREILRNFRPGSGVACLVDGATALTRGETGGRQSSLLSLPLPLEQLCDIKITTHPAPVLRSLRSLDPCGRDSGHYTCTARTGTALPATTSGPDVSSMVCNNSRFVEVLPV